MLRDFSHLTSSINFPFFNVGAHLRREGGGWAFFLKSAKFYRKDHATQKNTCDKKF